MTARYSVDPSLWLSVISIAVGNAGGVAGSALLGGYGTGYGGNGHYDDAAAVIFSSGGGGASSVALGVRREEERREEKIG